MTLSKPIDMRLPFPLGLVKRRSLKKIRGTAVEELLERYGAI